MSEGIAPTSETPRWQRGVHLLLVAAAATATLLSALLVVSISNNRAFQVDEVEHIHAAFHVAAGRVLYRDVFECHTPGLYLALAGLIDEDDPVASFQRARAAMLLVFFATVALAGRIAFHLRGRQAAWLVATGLLVHSTFVERGMEVRPDGVLALAVVAGLALTTTKLKPLPVHLLQGLAMGVAFAFTQKAAIATFGFGLVWLGSALRQRDWRLVVMPSLAWAVPILLVGAGFAAADALGPFLERNFSNPLGATARTRTNTLGFSPLPFLQLEGARNPVSYGCAITGLAFASAMLVTRAEARRALAPILVLGWVSFAGLWINPYPFPYFHVPVVVVLAAIASTLLPEAWRSTARGAPARWAVSLLLLASLAALSVPRLSSRARIRADFQLEHLRRVQAITPPDGTSFDLVGLYFRGDAYPFWVMTGPLLARYASGELPPLIDAVKANRPVAVTVNYRTLALPDAERLFISEHYAHGWGNLYVLGFDLKALGEGAERRIDVIAERTYRWTGDEGAIEVDGAPFTSGVLTEGAHTVRARRASSGGALRIPTPWDGEPIPPPRADLYVNFD